MDIITLFLACALLAAAIAAYLRLAFRSTPEPFWFTPLVLLIVGLLCVFLGQVDLLKAAAGFAGVVGQIATALIIAFGGWVLLGLRRG